MFGKLRGLYLVPPHGELLWRGEKRAIVKSRPFKGLDRPHAILSDHLVYGVASFDGPYRIDLDAFGKLRSLHRISDEEREAWWPEAEALWIWFVRQLWVYPEPIEYDVPPGVQTFLEHVELPEPTKLEPVRKLDLERFRAEGIDYDLEHPEERWRELLADLRYLGNSGYPRLKEGLPWGDWTLDDVLRYFGTIVDILRSRLFFPLVPPDPGDPRYESSFWQCYREAGARGYIKTKPPSPEEAKEWDRKRKEILKAREAALAIVFRKGEDDLETLLILRKNPPRVWSPPGGFLSGREPLEAALEEAKEETGVELRPLSERPVAELDADGTHVRVFAFRWVRGEAKPLAEAREVRWFPLKALPEPISPEPEVFRSAARLVTKANLAELSDLVARLPESFVVVPAWASLTGSVVYGRHRPNDIDVVLRSDAPSGTLLKLQRALHNVLGQVPVQFIVEPQGPTWSYLPLYDLVAVRRKDAKVEWLREPEFAERFYKAAQVARLGGIRHGVPMKHYDVAGEFYYPKEVRLAWEKWARRLVERGEQILVQPKFDGVRLHIDYDGKRLHVWSDKGLDRAKVFPGLEDALRKAGLTDVILDCEFVQCADVKTWRPVSRTLMGWMGSAKEPEIVPITVFIHDIMWWDGKRVAEWPYRERLDLLRELLPRPLVAGRWRLVVCPTWGVRSWEAFRKAIERAVAAEELSSEGAMLKTASFVYDPTEARTDVVKLKKLIEIDALIIGYRKVIAPKPPGAHWTRAEALRHLREGLRESRTYQLRLALLDEETGNLVPVEAKKRLSERDLRLDWDEDDQKWTGTDDPKLWTMFPPFTHRKAGGYAYGNSYNIRLERDPEPGEILTVAPMELTPFRDEAGWHLTWQHPIPRNMKPKGKPVGTIQAALAAHGLDPEKYRPWAVQVRRPKWAR